MKDDDWRRYREFGGIVGTVLLMILLPVATVLEISEQSGRIKLHNAYLAAGVGKALDPRNVEAQVFGGFNYGLAAAMMGEITVKDDQVQQTNFHDYPF